jgi:hypothetical protein
VVRGPAKSRRSPEIYGKGPEMGLKLEKINSGAIPNSLKASAYLP